MSTPPADGDAGETLVELLVAVVIVGIAVVGLLAGLLVTLDASTLHREQALSQNAARAWAEQVSASTYTDCATPASFAPPSPALPSGYTATVTAVQYWTGTSFASSCSGDTGIQRVTLRIAATNSPSPTVTQSLDVVVRKPCVSAC